MRDRTTRFARPPRATTLREATPHPRRIPPAAEAELPRPVADDRRGRRYDVALALGLVILVLLAPLPVGSNRGAAWMLWAMLLGVGGAGYLLARSLPPSVRPFRAGAVGGWLWLVAAALLFAALQTLPIARALPGWMSELPSTGAPEPPSLSLVPGATRLAVLRGFTMLLFFILMLEASARLGRALNIGWALFFGVAFYALWGLVSLRFFGDTFFWGEKASSLGAATGPFVNRNSFATFLGMGAVLGLALMLERARLPRMRHPMGSRLTSSENITTLLLWVIWVIVLVALLATQSRMGLAATIAGLGLVWLMMPRGSLVARRARLQRWLGAAVAVVVLLVLARQGETVLERSLFAEVDAAARLDLYTQVWGMIAARPFTGFGFDAFQPAYELYHRAPVSPALVWDKTHSSYLALWVELGLVFGSLPLIAAAGLAHRLVSVCRRRPHDVALVIAALGALVVSGVHALVDFGLEMQANQFLLLAILAMGVARRSTPQAPPAQGSGGSAT